MKPTLSLLLLAGLLSASPIPTRAQAPAAPTPPATPPPATVPVPKSENNGPAYPHESIALTKDIPYADTQKPRQQLDLYLPKNRKPGEKLPVIVFIHGGGWRNGNKASGAGFLTRPVASGQFAGVSLSYRLSTEAVWPAQIHDCKAAIRWIRAHASEYGLDSEKIAVWGSSAGAHLASLLGTTGDVPELEGSLGSNLSQKSSVSCVINFFGPQNFLSVLGSPNGVDQSKPDSALFGLLGGRVEDMPEVAKNASPLTHVSPGDAPLLTAHGNKDPLVPFSQAQQIHAALKKAGVESYLIEMKEAGHGFRSPELDTRIDQFLGKHLLGKPATISESPINKGN